MLMSYMVVVDGSIEDELKNNLLLEYLNIYVNNFLAVTVIA